MSNWKEMLDARNSEDLKELVREAPKQPDEDLVPPPDPNDYRPWFIQRGGRPAMFIDLRRFEPKTGMLVGCLMSYPCLFAVDYIGDHMVSLDFGNRRFVIEGNGLSGLAARLQQGSVLAIQEFSPKIWQTRSAGPCINRLLSVVKSEEPSD